MSPKGKRGKPPEEKLTEATSVVQFRPPVNDAGGSDPESSLAQRELSHMSPDDAMQALKDIAGINDRALVAHQAFEKSNKETKQLKAKWEDLTLQVQSRLQELTHPTDLPLFDERKAEEDLSRLQAAANAPAPPIEVSPDDAPF